MANYKRKKSRKNVVCTMCTSHRWKGNSSAGGCGIGARHKGMGRRANSRKEWLR